LLLFSYSGRLGFNPGAQLAQSLAKHNKLVRGRFCPFRLCKTRDVRKFIAAAKRHNKLFELSAGVRRQINASCNRCGASALLERINGALSAPGAARNQIYFD
jgi:hypothetical protein